MRKINIVIIPQILCDDTRYIENAQDSYKYEDFINDYIFGLIKKLNVVEDTIKEIDRFGKYSELVISLLDSDSSKSDNQDHDSTFYESARDIIYRRMYSFVDSVNECTKIGKAASLFIDTVVPIRIRGNKASFVEDAILTNLSEECRQCAKTAAQDLVNDLTYRLDVPREEVSEDMFVVVIDIIPGKKYARIVENFSY